MDGGGGDPRPNLGLGVGRRGGRRVRGRLPGEARAAYSGATLLHASGSRASQV